MQLMALELGGRVDRTGAGEFGKAELHAGESALFRDLPAEQTVWMSHRDSRRRAARRARASSRRSGSTPIAAFEDAGAQASTASSSTPRSCTPRTARRC